MRHDPTNTTVPPDGARFRALSAHDMAALGLEEVAYVKPVVIDGNAAYAIHAADGRHLAIVPDRAIAHATVIYHDLAPASVH